MADGARFIILAAIRHCEVLSATADGIAQHADPYSETTEIAGVTSLFDFLGRISGLEIVGQRRRQNLIPAVAAVGGVYDGDWSPG